MRCHSFVSRQQLSDSIFFFSYRYIHVVSLIPFKIRFLLWVYSKYLPREGRVKQKNVIKECTNLKSYHKWTQWTDCLSQVSPHQTQD